MIKMKGIIVPIVTPFTSDDKIDYVVTKALVEYLIEKGVDSLYPCGTTGEMLKMSIEERKDFVAAVIEYAAGKIPVFVHVGAATTADTLELAKHAYKNGAAGIGVVTPQFFNVNQRELEEYFITIAKSVPNDFPVYLYNIPQCAGNDITAELAESVTKKTENVVGIKYSYPDFNRFKEYLKINDGNFDVVCGPDQLFLPALAMGCKGAVSGCSQCGPEPFCDVYSKFCSGDLEGARAAQNQANELATIIKAGANMAYFKATMEYNGLPKSHMRAPALDLTKEETDKLYAELDAYHKKYK